MNDEGYLQEQLVTEDIGEEIFAFAAEIYPICRSITGRGVRETLSAIGTHIKLEVHEVPTGTAVFDWVIPREWNSAKHSGQCMADRDTGSSTSSKASSASTTQPCSSHTGMPQ